MNRPFLLLSLFSVLLLLVTACGDDDYYYPSVRLEFVTVSAGADGHVQDLLPDEGVLLPVSKDLTGSTIPPLTSKRVLSNYEMEREGNQSVAVIYSLQSLFVANPKLPTDPSFGGVLKYDPVELVSIWPGRNYLNLILNVKVDIGSGKKQIFDIIEESDDSSGSERVVTLSLYYDANGENQYYNRKLYMSVPLIKYADSDAPGQTIIIKFKYHTRSASGESVESDKYCHPGFTYVPYEQN